MTVAISRPTTAIVMSRWVYSWPPSASERCALVSSGMATEVSTPPISNSKTMLGRVLATV